MSAVIQSVFSGRSDDTLLLDNELAGDKRWWCRDNAEQLDKPLRLKTGGG